MCVGAGVQRGVRARRGGGASRDARCGLLRRGGGRAAAVGGVGGVPLARARCAPPVETWARAKPPGRLGSVVASAPAPKAPMAAHTRVCGAGIAAWPAARRLRTPLSYLHRSTDTCSEAQWDALRDATPQAELRPRGAPRARAHGSVLVPRAISR
eukprot:scaffold21977_cov53-Phaeocystis_antarctica.AAC.2